MSKCCNPRTIRSLAGNILAPLRKMRFSCTALAASVIFLSGQVALANSVLISVEAPLVTTSQASNVTTEGFDNLAGTTSINSSGYSLPSGIGTVDAANSVVMKNQNVNGGDEGGDYLFTNNSDFAVNLANPAGYVGFWWNAGGISGGGDDDTVEVFGSLNGTGTEALLATFTVSDLSSLIIDATKSDTPIGHRGNPTPSFYNQDNTSFYAYVNLQLDDADLRITKVVFSGRYFEVDNISVSSDYGAVSSFPPGFTFDPADSSTGVAANSNITITASEAIRLLNDTALNNTNIDALITLKETNSSGADIAFDATIAGNVITIDPTSNLSPSQQVYVAINGASVEDTSDVAGAVTDATFTVVADTMNPLLALTSPSDDETGVNIGNNIALTCPSSYKMG
ncbi:hypothetical protein B9057_04120 [Aestuarium zhoushanense]|nr:hypothetical protein B9057_04120 [Aestuarium zhoushanense]